MTAVVFLDSAPTDGVQAKFVNLTEADMFKDKLLGLSFDLLERIQSGSTAYGGNGSLPVDCNAQRRFWLLFLFGGSTGLVVRRKWW